MNKVVLIGRLTKDVVLRKTQSGTSVLNCTLAVNRRFGQQEADFITCIAWNKTADVMAKYLKKGSKIAIEGRIETGSFDDKDGKKVYTTDVVIERLDFLDTKQEQTQQQSYQAQQQNAYAPLQNQYRNDLNNFDENSNLGIGDDELPF